MRMRLRELCSCLKEYDSFNLVEQEVTGITYDSRKVKAGCVFVAIQGHALDGHNFIADAVRRGAVALVVEKRIDVPLSLPYIVVSNSRRALAFMSSHFYGDPSSHMTIIGITGTNGKTTTSYFTKSIIEASGSLAGLIGTIQYQIGENIIPAKETTPASVDIHAYLCEMLKAKIKYAVIEASSHALSQHRLDGVRFRSAIFTNLSAEHLDYHENIKNYRAEKLNLFKELRKDSFSILNIDHNTSKHFAACTKSQVVWYGIKRKNADVAAEVIQMNANGSRFKINSPWGKAIIDTRLAGKHNIYNALASAANGLALGFTMETVKRGLESLNGVPGRLEKIDCGQDFSVYIDFAHTHQALQVILSTLRDVTAGRIILVFGCGGDRDRKKRPKMGHIAEKYADIFWITNDNPRSEEPQSIISEILKGVNKEALFYVQPDRKLAIEEALSEAKRGDVVIIAGKGHEQYQIFRDTTVPFSDHGVVRQALSRRKVYEQENYTVDVLKCDSRL